MAQAGPNCEIELKILLIQTTDRYLFLWSQSAMAELTSPPMYLESRGSPDKKPLVLTSTPRMYFI
jgi:hypothetical protein